MRVTPPIGIIGGYGPSTSAEFCSRLVKYALELRNDHAPSFIMDSIPISMDDAQKSIAGEQGATLSLIHDANEGIARMAALGIPVVALPCNTLHAYFDSFKVPDGMKMLHIADSVVSELKERGIRRVGFLASGTTVKSSFYFDRLREAGIEAVLPVTEEQDVLNRHIAYFVRTGSVLEDTSTVLRAIMDDMTGKEVEAVVLACTDIAGMIKISGVDSAVPIVDSMDALAKECARYSVRL